MKKCEECNKTIHRTPGTSSKIWEKKKFCSLLCFKYGDPHKRFLRKVKIDQKSGCWNWIGGLVYGYSQFHLTGGKNIRGHRYSYEYYVGKIPEGLQIDHLCKNRKCVNPNHLEPVTGRENLMRSDGVSAKNARKTHCKRGHPLKGKNLIQQRTGARSCYACQQFHARRRTKKLREMREPKRDEQGKILPRMVTACCGADLDCSGGGYIEQEIVPVTCCCSKCFATEPKMKQKGRGTMPKVPF